jgi:hypothetical protein
MGAAGVKVRDKFWRVLRTETTVNSGVCARRA